MVRLTARARHLLVAVAVALAAAVVVPVGAPATPAHAKGQGTTPFGDISFWAEQMRACGLSGPQLAAMMLAPVYPETGAPGEQAPSPMTLSRWDDQARLYAFGDRGTPYRNAFWNPGVGMWQFDSAGSWNLNAATSISTWTSAAQAAHRCPSHRARPPCAATDTRCTRFVTVSPKGFAWRSSCWPGPSPSNS